MGNLSGLPSFLAKTPGLHSGFMIAHVTAAALASENKQLATPASIDSLPTSANQEDHVSMATNAARRLLILAENVMTILAIEIMSSISREVCWHKHCCKTDILLPIWQEIAKQVVFYADDRVISKDIEHIKEWLVKTNLFYNY